LNILLTSAGRRNYLVDFFKVALHPYGGKVHVINSQEDVSSAIVADFFCISPLITDQSYPGFVLDYCIEHSIELVIPLFDIDLPILAKNKNIFSKHNIRVLVGDVSLMEMVNDKWATQEFLKFHGFLTKPSFLKIDAFEEAYQNKEVDFPVFVKPRYGMGSIGLCKANNFKDLNFYYEYVVDTVSNSYLKNQSDDFDQVIIQATLPGQEYGLDVINDLQWEISSHSSKEEACHAFWRNRCRNNCQGA
jgi:carbamoyl-phosphate synthase large subunit